MKHRRRPIKPSFLLASTALTALCTGLALQHSAPEAHGTTAEETDAETMDAAWSAMQGESHGALLVDFVDPAEGEGSSDEAIAERAAALGLSPSGFYFEEEHLYRIEGDTKALARLREQLRNDPLVEGVEPEIQLSLPDGFAQSAPSASDDEIARPSPHKPNDPMYPRQWHFKAVNTPQAWAHTRGAGAVVAVIDTGVAWRKFTWQLADGSEMRFNPVPDLAGIEFVHPKTFVADSAPDGLDDHAHGTHVAGTIAQATNNGIGVAGIAHEAAIMPLKVLAGSGRGSSAGVANAVRFAADNNAHVINMSLGSPFPSRVLSKAVAYAREKGTTVVCAAGNSGRGRVDYPAANDGCFAVAATTFSGERSFYSNWGKALDIAAPGGDTRSDENGDGYPDGVLQNTIKIQQPDQNDYLWFMGTSMAAPHVAGIAGLVVAEGVTNPDEVEAILQKTAKHPNNVEWDRDFGAGIVDAEAAVLAAKSAYNHERGLLAGALTWLGLMGLGLFGGGLLGASSSRSRAGRAGQWLGLGAMTAVSAGIFGAPLAQLLGSSAAGLGLAGLGSGLYLSALVPVALTLGLLQFRGLRTSLIGLNLGWAALMLHGAIVLPTVLSGVPGGMAWDRLFLAANALLCLALARRVAKVSSNRENKALAAG